MPDQETPVTPPSQDGNRKKPFEPPRLQVYGDIATLTRTVGRAGVPDGGHGSNIRTSP